MILDYYCYLTWRVQNPNGFVQTCVQTEEVIKCGKHFTRCKDFLTVKNRKIDPL